ncbi:unnamed protein product [Calypogeia fissa]
MGPTKIKPQTPRQGPPPFLSCGSQFPFFTTPQRRLFLLLVRPPRSLEKILAVGFVGVPLETELTRAACDLGRCYGPVPEAAWRSGGVEWEGRTGSGAERRGVDDEAEA